jgi:tetratricopeptide (TPR) repeat protein
MQRFWLGECYFRLGRRGKAGETWKGMYAQKSFTPQEVYYKGLGLKGLGRKREANGVFKGALKSALQREEALRGIKDRIPLEHFNLLNYDRELAYIHCSKMITYLGLGRRKEASKEFQKAWRITKDLGHYRWISDSFLNPKNLR